MNKEKIDMCKVKKDKRILRVANRKQFAVISNATLQDSRLSWKARGVLAYLLSLPDDWVIIVEELVSRAPDGVDSLRSGLKELEKLGYISKRRTRDEAGKITGTEWFVHEEPQTENPDMDKADMESQNNDALGNPQPEKPYMEKPRLENPTLLNTNSTKDPLNLKKQQQPQDARAQKNEHPPEIASIFTAYESEIGMVTKMTRDDIMDLFDSGVPCEWFVRAFREASANNARRWSYAKAIIERWKIDGFGVDNRKPRSNVARPPKRDSDKPGLAGGYVPSTASEIVIEG